MTSDCDWSHNLQPLEIRRGCNPVLGECPLCVSRSKGLTVSVLAFFMYVPSPRLSLPVNTYCHILIPDWIPERGICSSLAICTFERLQLGLLRTSHIQGRRAPSDNKRLSKPLSTATAIYTDSDFHASVPPRSTGNCSFRAVDERSPPSYLRLAFQSLGLSL